MLKSVGCTACDVWDVSDTPVEMRSCAWEAEDRCLWQSLQVTSIVACMLETGSDAIVEHLFGDCDLLGWLLNAPAQFEPERRAGDER